MLGRLGLIMLIGGWLPVIAVAGEKTPEILQRTGPWTLDYDRDSCHLLARFGSSDDGVMLRLTRYLPTDTFDLGIYRNKLWEPGNRRTQVKIDFGLGARPISYPVNGEAGKLQALLFNSERIDAWEFKESIEPPAITPEQEARVTGLTFAVKGNRPVRLEFGSLGKPLAQMRACTDNLVKSWGFDPAVQAGLSRKVKPTTSPGTWFKSSDYPHTALRGGQSGIVQFRLDVDESGKVTDCKVLARTDPDQFGELTCMTLRKRAKLEPALDAQGKPTRSFFISKVQWMIAS